MNKAGAWGRRTQQEVKRGRRSCVLDLRQAQDSDSESKEDSSEEGADEPCQAQDQGGNELWEI